MKNPFLGSYVLLLFLISFLFSCESDMMDIGDATSDGSGEYASFHGGMENSSGGEGSGGNSNIQPGQITAGEWKDLNDWSYWQSVLARQDYSKMSDYWGFDLNQRYSVELKDGFGNPHQDIPITLKLNGQPIWTTKTDNKGKAELWGMSVGSPSQRTENTALTIDIDNGLLIHSNVLTYEKGINQISYNVQTPVFLKAEIAFVVDATGSMGDEIEYLKVELKDVLQKVKNNQPQFQLITGSVFYRDQGDDYVTRVSPFTSDVNKTMDFIKKQSAEGGGDYPEAVHTALEKAMSDLQWSSFAKTRLLFLVLDAPPHHRPDVLLNLQKSIKTAAAKGIKIIPITASGIDKETEFLMRFFAVSTNGTYVFITNHSGIGNDHLEPTVGDYEVEFLNDLMVRLINESLD
ncbi:VWA domain-containing protein [Aquiflexum sp.]|uniref:vWA domain-containing protein n=1 Tax=Aquiflexum sp. TaxID=1872584 RepID=UPI003593DCB6